MSMQTIKGLIQGSDQWKEFRGDYLVASEAPVIMGDSPHTSRTELLNLKTTGDEKEVNEWVEKFIFAKGHEHEAQARPIAEALAGQELYPITGVREVDGLKLLASFDGATMFEDDSWEHKTLNEKLREFFGADDDLPMMYAWQLEHQMLVLGTDSCIFAASLGTEDSYHEYRYTSVPERREQLLEGWKLFLEDLKSHEVKTPKAEIVGRSPEDLPALRVEVTGMVTASNLKDFKQVAMDVFGNINTELNTDEDFANAEKTVKWCSTVEQRLESTKEAALAQTQSIDELFRTMDDLREEARRIRLNLHNKVQSRKKERKVEIAQAAKAQFDEHIATLNKALGGDWMPPIQTDFNAAMKGKRTIATLESAAHDEFTRARIEANRIASRIEANLEFFDNESKGYEFLFADKKDLLINNESEPLKAIVRQRIADHKAEEERRIQAEADRREAERKRQEPEPAAQASPEPKPSNVSAIRETASRPTDDQIIEALALHYRVHESKVIEWLLDMDLDSASNRVAATL